MIRIKDSRLTITGNNKEVLHEFAEIVTALYWKKILSAEDLVMVIAKGILEAKELDKEIEEEEKEDDTDE